MTLQSEVPSKPAVKAATTVAKSASAGQSTSLLKPDLLGLKIGLQGDHAVTEALAGAREGIIEPHERLDLAHLVILTGDSGAMIEASNGRVVLTGVRGARNDCRLLLRKSYSTLRCEVHAAGSEAHLAFVMWRNDAWKELQTIDIKRPPPRASRESHDGRLSTIVEYRAEAPDELHGFVWRGGLLSITGLALIP
jgi:hypothetical protein